MVAQKARHMARLAQIPFDKLRAGSRGAKKGLRGMTSPAIDFASLRD